MPGSRTTAMTGILFSVMIGAWGLNYVLVRLGLAETPPLWLAGLRSIVGAGGIALLARRSLLPPRFSVRDIRDAALIGVPNTGLFFGLWFVAAESVPPGEAAVLIYTFPLWVALISAGALSRRVSRVEWAAIAAGFLGVFLISEPWRSMPGALGALPVGELLAGSIAWAAGTIAFQRRFHGEDVQPANGWQLTAGAAVLLGAALLVEPVASPVPTASALFIVLWLGLVGTALSYGIWFTLLDRYRATRLSAFVFLVPVVAFLASFVIVRERLDPVQGLGVALVLSSVYVTNRQDADSGRRSG